jgi:hypothetical protein
MNKEKLHMSDSTLVWFDLEGIADDGLGYTVSITTANGRPEERVHRNWTIGGFRLNSRSSPRISSRAAHHSRSKRPSRSQTLHLRHPDEELKETEKRIEIFETRSVEVRESFHDVSGSEEIRIWKSGSERGENSDPGRSTPAYGRQSTERNLSPQMANNVTQTVNADEPENTYRVTSSQPLAVPGSAVVRQPSTRSSTSNQQWLSPPGSPRRRPIHTLNTSQNWSNSHSPRSRSSASSKLDEDTSWMLEIATMRDILHWTQMDGSMHAEDGSMMEQIHEGDEAV